MFHYIEQGGVIMYILLLANILSVAIGMWKFFIFQSTKRHLGAIASDLYNESKKELLGSKPSFGYIKERISNYVFGLEKGLDFIKITASTAPLLGLLGTVFGILAAFETISQTGLGRPELFAKGIATALITTAGGLLVAIPNNVIYNYLQGRLANIEANMENILAPQLGQE